MSGGLCGEASKMDRGARRDAGSGRAGVLSSSASIAYGMSRSIAGFALAAKHSRIKRNSLN